MILFLLRLKSCFPITLIRRGLAEAVIDVNPDAEK
jgi:hypothetical protein